MARRSADGLSIRGSAGQADGMIIEIYRKWERTGNYNPDYYHLF